MISARVAYSTTLDYVKHREELEKITDLITKTISEGEFEVIAETLSPSIERVLLGEGYCVTRRWDLKSDPYPPVHISWDFAHEEM